MNRFLLRTIAVASFLAATAGVASAQTAVGDWAGTMTMPQGNVRVAAHLKSDNGVLGGMIESPDLNAKLPLSGAKLEGDKLTLSSPDGDGHRLDLKWDAAIKGWTGTYTGSLGTFPVKLTEGVLPAAPAVTGLDGEWNGALSVQGQTLRLQMTITTAAGKGTEVILKSLDQNNAVIPAAGISRNGDDVRVSIPSIMGEYTGKLSADGKTLAGKWAQAGNEFPLDMTRK
jgi:hypothetical protein